MQGMCGRCKVNARVGGGYCRDCKREYNRERYARPEVREKALSDRYRHYHQKLKGTEEHRRKTRERKLKRQYGLTPGTEAAMLTAQHGLCALCAKTLRKDNTHVDHDHETGRVRGLLCIGCNVGLGQYERMLSALGVERISAYIANENRFFRTNNEVV